MKAFWLERYFPAATADPAIAAPLLQQAFANAKFSWAHADYANREAPVFDARDRLGAITAHSLVIAGAHELMPPQKGRELADGIAGAKLALFEHSGHFAPLEEPEGFQQAVLEFLGVDSGELNTETPGHAVDPGPAHAVGQFARCRSRGRRSW